MQSRMLALTRVFKSQNTTLLRRGITTSPPCLAAEDHLAMPHGSPEETKEKYEPETGKADYCKDSEEQDQRSIEYYDHHIKGTTEPISHPKPVHHHNIPTLNTTGVHNPAAGPTFQQKRQCHGGPPSSSMISIVDATCAGIDGWARPEEAEEREEEEEDDREYYLRHKASPLSEISVADTRKPITQVTDSRPGVEEEEEEEAASRTEQGVTAEEVLLRAAENWRRVAAMGDPDSPHGKVVRKGYDNSHH